MSVEFIYDKDCPNVAATRANLLRAFVEKGVPAKWTEWERSSADTPAYARAFGSPAILINGRDIANLVPTAASACRIYHLSNGTTAGVPSVELIVRALSNSVQNHGRPADARPVKRNLPLVPAMLVALLPKVACPACWPAYAGVLSAVGLGFLARTEYLMPLTAAFLSVVLLGLAYGARKRSGYGQLFLGITATVSVLVGKFALHSSFLFFSGLALLVGSSLWNTWPRKRSNIVSCCECAPAGSGCEK